jgi:7-keto-8-aminopelargonate synthetase-like enzyme
MKDPARIAQLHSPPGPMVRLDDRDLLYFSGTSYLGLQSRPEVLAAIGVAARSYGVHAATSRVRAGISPPVVAVEAAAADYFGTQTAVHCASGYLAPWLLLQAIAPEYDLLVVDRRAHAALRDAVACSRLPVEVVDVHCAGVEFEAAIDAAAMRGARPLVLADAVLPATGEPAPVTDLVLQLDRCVGGGVFLDEAHGWGVVGPDGRGVYDAAGLWPCVNRWGTPATGTRLFACGTLGKALGGYGGIVPADHALATAMATRSDVYSAAAPPAAVTAAASAAALVIARQEPQLRSRLAANLRRLDQALPGLGRPGPFPEAAIRSIPHPDAAVLAHVHQELLRAGIYVPHVRGYGGAGPAGVLRIAVFADHDASQIDQLVDALRRAGLPRIPVHGP